MAPIGFSAFYRQVARLLRCLRLPTCLLLLEGGSRFSLRMFRNQSIAKFFIPRLEDVCSGRSLGASGCLHRNGDPCAFLLKRCFVANLQKTTNINSFVRRMVQLFQSTAAMLVLKFH